MRKFKRSSLSLPSQLQNPQRSQYCLTASRQLLRSACIHAFTHSLAHSSVRVLAHSLTHSLTHSLIPSFIHPFIHLYMSSVKVRYSQSCVSPCMRSVWASCLVIPCFIEHNLHHNMLSSHPMCIKLTCNYHWVLHVAAVQCICSMPVGISFASP